MAEGKKVKLWELDCCKILHSAFLSESMTVSLISIIDSQTGCLYEFAHFQIRQVFRMV